MTLTYDSLRADYQENYDRICADHLAEYEATGHNPFMDGDDWHMVEAETIALLLRYTEPGGIILDAGVGMGRLLSTFTELERHGIDIADAYLPYAQEAGIDAIHGDLEELPYPDEQFDYVVCADILEHVIDLNACLDELHRVLRPDGLLFIRVPHREEIAPYLASPYKFVHLRSFQEAELRMLLTRVFGFTIVQTWVGGELSVVARKQEEEWTPPELEPEPEELEPDE